MATMSLVMAEASQALSTVAVVATEDIQPLIRSYNGSHSDCSDDQSVETKSQSYTCETATVTTTYSIMDTKSRVSSEITGGYYCVRQDCEMDDMQQEYEHVHFNFIEEEEEDDNDRDTEDCSIHSFGLSWIKDLPDPSHQGEDRSKNEYLSPILVQNISQIQGSSNSYTANSMSDELSTSTSIPYIAHTPSSSNSTSTSSAHIINHDLDSSILVHTPYQHRRINVSFVPLDLDAPLEEQHGGKFDVILHKMTEDILSTTFLHRKDYRLDSELTTTHDLYSNGKLLEDDSDPMAIQRVLRLIQYQDNHPESILMDHPLNIQHVMSRWDISNILSKCLTGIVSRSGLPVSTPRYRLIHGPDTSIDIHNSTRMDSEDEWDQIAHFNYPLIAKPVAAAGTKQSHKMVIVIRRDGLSKVPLPCLIQEYVNHDSILHKVYVLGEMVFVYPRTSLPNLTTSGDTTNCTPPYVEFDSQESYPTMSDFQPIMNPQILAAHGDMELWENNSRTPVISSQELQPIAHALRQAFGLQLFGFDVLVTDKRDGTGKELLVVDVNYFPSYKEVSDFAPRLARYLAKIALENRMKQL
jgi:inositol-1,3,4-trisphosphate 5/6-kinase/inositol-tetrakisphosphate 1-kinase